MRSFAALIVSALLGCGLAANKRPFPSSTHSAPSAKQTCLCSHESNSVDGNTSRGVSNAHPTDMPAVAVGSGLKERGTSVELNSNSFTKLHVAASASDEAFKRRRELRQLVSSLSNGRVSDENADVAVKALEESLEADGSTPEGHHWLLGVLNGLLVISKDRAKNRTRDMFIFEADTWIILEKACTIPDYQCSSVVWKRFFRGNAVNVALRMLATDTVKQMIISIALEVSNILAGSGIPANSKDPHLYMDAPFFYLERVFGFSDSLGPTYLLPESLLRTAKGRDDFDKILHFLYSNLRLRFQVQAISQLNGDERARNYPFKIIENYWEGAFFSPEFDALEVGSADKRDSRNRNRQDMLQSECHKFLTTIPQAALDVLVEDCVRDLYSLTRSVTETLGLELPSSLDEAQYFLAALVESFPGLSSATLDMIGGYSGLYRRVFFELRNPQFQTKVLHIRSLPFTLWRIEWVGFFRTDSVDCVRNELDSQSFSLFLSGGQREEEKSE